jgi:hypothetical protein
MNRRGFFKGAIGLAFVPMLPAAALPAAAASRASNPLFGGEIGRWEGVKIHQAPKLSPEAVRVYSRHLWAESSRVRRLQSLQAELNHIRSSLLQRVL